MILAICGSGMPSGLGGLLLIAIYCWPVTLGLIAGGAIVLILLLKSGGSQPTNVSVSSRTGNEFYM